MLERQGGWLQYECDKCTEVLETETGEFEEARATMKDEGWQARKLGNVWIHFCNSCRD